MLKSSILFVVVPFIYCFILYKQIKQRVVLFDYVLMFTFVIYLTLMLSFTIFPIPIQEGQREAFETKISFIPFKDIIAISSSKFQFFRQVIGNIILFVPLGFFLPVLKEIPTKIKVILTGIFSSLIIELMQLLIGLLIVGYKYKVLSIDDIILNSIGFYIGFIIFYFTNPILIGLRAKNKKNNNIKKK